MRTSSTHLPALLLISISASCQAALLPTQQHTSNASSPISCFNTSLPHPLVFPQHCLNAISSVKLVHIPPDSNSQIRSVTRSFKSCTANVLLPPMAAPTNGSMFDDIADECVYPVGRFGGSYNFQTGPERNVPGVFVLGDNSRPGYTIYPTFWPHGANQSAELGDDETACNASRAKGQPEESQGPVFNYTAGFFGP
ncbi:hypothetical protein MMC20_002981 [Loxospora ochrophaea]|nr:hypothetical protein [Loxospora ochrophaea]